MTDIIIFKNYFTNCTTFKSVRLHFNCDTVLNLLECLDCNKSIEKISLCKNFFPNNCIDIELQPVPKLYYLSINSSNKNKLLCHYMKHALQQPKLSKFELLNFKLKKDVIKLLVEIIDKHTLQKIKLYHYTADTDDDELDNFSKILLTSQIVSITDNGQLNKYLLRNLNLSTTLRKLTFTNDIHFEKFKEIDNLIKKLSSTNITNFYCTAFCHRSSFLNEFKPDVEKRWSNFLDSNYTITSFYFLITSLFDSEMEIKLTNFTNRNKDIHTNTRFAKVKPFEQ